jgi:glycosyltransferase involved in cell wall biosynthesis
MKRISQELLRAPAKVVDLGMEHTRAQGTSVEGYRSLWCLSRTQGAPSEISFWDVNDDVTVNLDDLRKSSNGQEQSVIGEAAQQASGASKVILTVVICTRNRPSQLQRALESLRTQSDFNFRTLIVDNAPTSSSTAEVVEQIKLDRCEYIVEPKKGLSRARNAALGYVATEYVAWMDDGEVADVNWVQSLKQGFTHPSDPIAVCGVMLPAELETEAQIRFEQFGGFNKGRSLFPEVLRADSPRINPLYPLPAIGSGGNMAFRLHALRAAGGFDPFLGAGTRTHGGEETKVFAVLLRSGGTILHWPKAITWHFHRRRMTDLHKQFYGYSAGLSAFYASMIRSEPRIVRELIKLGPLVSRDLGLHSGGIRTDQLPKDFPKSLLWASRRGLLAGSFGYGYEALSNNA